jgi:predicted acetyltransferase
MLQHKIIPPNFLVKKVSNTTDLQDFIHVISSIHAPEATQKYYNAAADVLLYTPNCPAALYVGYAANLPVSALFLFEDKSSETAGIYSVATLPSHRHQGFASALTQVVLQGAAQRGAKFATLQATAAGLPLYKRLGFMECGEVMAFSSQTTDNQ